MKKMLFVFNPKSGRGQIKSSLTDVIDIFVKGGYEVVVHPSQCKNDTKNIICSDGKNYDTVVVSGGDGTLSEAVNALMKISKDERPYLGYIPTGTTNDFAVSNKIPKNNAKKAAENIVNGDVLELDTGKFNDEFFSYVAGFGAFTNVSYATNQQAKNVLGYAAYILEGIMSLGNIKPHKAKLEYDGKETEGEFVLGLVSNSFSVGGVKYNDNLDVSLNDGYFECVLVKNPTNAIDFQIIIADLLTNNIKSDKFIIMKAKKIKFAFEEEVDWTLDGEYGGKVKEAEIENLNKAIKVLTSGKK